VETNRGKYYIFNVGSKFVAVHTLTVYRESGVIAPLILNLGPRWRSVVNFTLRLLCLLGNKRDIHRVGPWSGLDGV